MENQEVRFDHTFYNSILGRSAMRALRPSVPIHEHAEADHALRADNVGRRALPSSGLRRQSRNPQLFGSLILRLASPTGFHQKKIVREITKQRADAKLSGIKCSRS